MPSLRARFTMTLAAALLAAGALPLAAVATGYAPSVTRLSGPDRYGTSAAVAATYAAPQATVFVASGLGFADALSGAPVAGKMGAPLLLVTPTSIPPRILTQLQRLQPSSIVILGGLGSVSAAVASALDALTVPSGGVSRVWGADRYATSAKIVETYYPSASTVYIASGANFPDALSIAPLAGTKGAPLLLVQHDAIPPLVAAQLERLQPHDIVIAGGTASVSDPVATSLATYLAPGGQVTRMSGADRYATSARISQLGYASLPPAPVAYVASGAGFADALSGAPLAAKKGVPLLLIQRASIPGSVGTELLRLKLASLVILGGPAVIADGTLLTLSFYLDTGSPPPGACPIFPPSNVWNADVSGLPVAANSATMIAAIGTSAHLHPDFDAVGDGIPYNIVSAATPTSTVTFDYDGESDHVPYPIPASPLIEGGSDRHILLLDPGQCRLWELFAARASGGHWRAGSGATWDLTSNALRPAGWTSADAAGLPMLPGLVRYDEVNAGAILHALRFTASSTCAGYVYPARHQAGSGSCSAEPPMGLRVRLKASVDISGFAPQARVVLTALKTYGMILADNGSPWYVSGAPDVRWDDDGLHAFHTLHGSDFEVVDTSGLVNGP